MPAAAVIPAPIAYIKVVAVKKLVVEFLSRITGAASRLTTWFNLGTSPENVSALNCVERDLEPLL